MPGFFRKGKYQRNIIIPCLVLLFSLSIIGVSVSSWNNETKTEMNCNTGYLQASLVLTYGRGWSLSDNVLTYNNSRALPGQSYSAYFRIHNIGSIPIKFRVRSIDDTAGIITNLVPSDWQVLDCNIESTGQITITAPAQPGTYNFSAVIEIKQWNLPSGGDD